MSCVSYISKEASHRGQIFKDALLQEMQEGMSRTLRQGFDPHRDSVVGFSSKIFSSLFLAYMLDGGLHDCDSFSCTN